MSQNDKDKIIKIGDSTIQHGNLNKRIYLMKLGAENIENLLASLNKLAEENKYTKIFAKIPANAYDSFIADGYKRESHIPKFYKFKKDAYFMAKYFCDERENVLNKEKISEIINISQEKETENNLPELDNSFELIECQPEHTKEMASVYSRVFDSYPFPIDDPNYLAKTMRQNIKYYGIIRDQKIIALSSSEMDFDGKNAEMTDFATLPEFRGNGLALYLLQKMENDMVEQDIKTLYTIARSISFGMNITFAKAGYDFSGTLVNNTNICGDFECMNVWYKN